MTQNHSDEKTKLALTATLVEVLNEMDQRDSYDPPVSQKTIGGLLWNVSEGWHPYRPVSVTVEYRHSKGAQNLNRSVFESWMILMGDQIQKRTSSDFNKNDQFIEENLDHIERDLDLWIEKFQNPPEQMKQVLISLMETAYKGYRSDTFKVQFASKTMSLLMDRGWLEDPSLKSRLLMHAVISGDAEIIKKLHREGFSLNTEIRPKDAQEAEYNFSLKKLDPNLIHQSFRQAGFFIRDAETANLLKKLNYDWTKKDSTNQSSMEILQGRVNHEFKSIPDRSNVLKLMSQEMVIQHSENPQEAIWGLLKKATKQEDVAIALRGVKWVDLRGPNGENVIHMLAAHAPSSFIKYAKTKQGELLLESPDKNGLPPIAYAVVGLKQRLFSDYQTEWVRFLGHKFKKMDYLKVLSLSLEEQNFEGAFRKRNSSFNLLDDWWIQNSPQKRLEALQSAEGQEVLKKFNQKIGKRPQGALDLSWHWDTDPRILMKDTSSSQQSSGSGENANSIEMQGLYEHASTKEECEAVVRECLLNFASKSPQQKGLEREIENFKQIALRAQESGVDFSKIEEEFKSGEIKVKNLDKKELWDKIEKVTNFREIKMELERNMLRRSVKPSEQDGTPKKLKIL